MRRHFDDDRGGARMHREDAPRYRFHTDLWIVGVAPISFYAERQLDAYLSLLFAKQLNNFITLPCIFSKRMFLLKFDIRIYF